MIYKATLEIEVDMDEWEVEHLQERDLLLAALLHRVLDANDKKLVKFEKVVDTK